MVATEQEHELTKELLASRDVWIPELQVRKL